MAHLLCIRIKGENCFNTLLRQNGLNVYIIRAKGVNVHFQGDKLTTGGKGEHLCENKRDQLFIGKMPSVYLDK